MWINQGIQTLRYEGIMVYMTNIVSDTGFWISNNDNEHRFIPELSQEINNFIAKHNIQDVYDFGCGRGEYLQKAVEQYPHIAATGFEGYQTTGVFSNIVKEDLSVSLDLPPVDLVISIEVGEHIPVEFEQIFIDNITKTTKKHLILSWAIIGQGGLGHINERNNFYIIEEITKRGFIFDGEATSAMRTNMPRLWIKNTLMVFYRV